MLLGKWQSLRSPLANHTRVIQIRLRLLQRLAECRGLPKRFQVLLVQKSLWHESKPLCAHYWKAGQMDSAWNKNARGLIWCKHAKNYGCYLQKGRSYHCECVAHLLLPFHGRPDYAPVSRYPTASSHFRYQTLRRIPLYRWFCLSRLPH